MEIGYILGIMPDWEALRDGPIQKSRVIQQYEYDSHIKQHSLPNLRWTPLSIDELPQHLIKAVVVAEDSRFFDHDGIDEQAIKKAFEYNLEKGKVVYGASTISQQTVKNQFLTQSRNPLRKLHELILTFLMEANLGKRRILEIYLNIAEFGKGVYGVEAAAREYYQKSARYLSSNQAIELAASLPSPVRHNPRTRTRTFLKRKNKIKRHMRL